MSLTPALRVHLNRKFVHVSDDERQVAIVEFERFAKLAIAGERFFFPCSQLVDDIWHAAITETRDYAEFCESIGPGRFLHHTGIKHDVYAVGRSIQEQDDEDLSVLASYIENFGNFCAEGVKHWLAAQNLMTKMGWTLDQLNTVIAKVAGIRTNRETIQDHGRVFTTPREFLLDFHKKYSGGSIAFFSKQTTSVDGQNTYEILAGEIANLVPPANRILDIGCGTGALFGPLSAKSSEIQYFGIDLSPEEIYLARRRIYSPKATFLCADALNLPFKDNHFDVVTAHMTMHLFDQPETLISELMRVLRPGGKLVFNVPSRRCDTEPEQAYADILGLYQKFNSTQKLSLGSPAFRSEEGITDLLRKLIGGASGKVREYLTCVDPCDESAIDHFRGLYPYALLRTEDTGAYKETLKAALKAFSMGNPGKTLDRRMAVYVGEKAWSI